MIAKTVVGTFGFGEHLALYFYECFETIDAEITRSYLATVGQSPNTDDNASCGNNGSHCSCRRRTSGQDVFHDQNASALDIFGEAALENKGRFLNDQLLVLGKYDLVYVVFMVEWQIDGYVPASVGSRHKFLFLLRVESQHLGEIWA